MKWPNLVEIRTVEETNSTGDVTLVQITQECAYCDSVELPDGVIPPLGVVGPYEGLENQLLAAGYQPWKYGVGTYYHPGTDKAQS